MRQRSPLPARLFLALPLLLLTFACATAGRQGPASYDAVADRLVSTVQAYRAMEPRLTPEKKRQFEEAYAAIAKAYRTSGILLDSVAKAPDEASARTATFSYQRIMTQMPEMVDKLSRLVEGFKKGG